MKKTIWIMAAIVISCLSAPSVYASSWGCECMLCMSNPGGAKQFKECHPPIKKLERHLARGGRFPQCKETEEQGYRTANGVQFFYTCKETYGEDYKLAEVTEEGEYQSTRQVCRKFLGYRKQMVCDDDAESLQCSEKEVPYYDIKERHRRPKPNYVQLVKPDGTKSERVWYKKKKKKKRW